MEPSFELAGRTVGGAPSGIPRTVAVALSGGVDSAVAAALLVKAGHKVQGIMLRLWSEEGDDQNRCCTAEAAEAARSVAEMLAIPLRLVDARDVFRSFVVEPFLVASAAGDTPNPCLACNRRVRFGFLLDRAVALGADRLATGHYARVESSEGGQCLLRRGVDPAKDQSYVLHVLSQEQLGRLLLPLGGMTKRQVRRLAAELGLPVAERPDSLDLCWVGREGLDGFLERHLPPGALAPGPIVDSSGTVLGQHRGLARYTLGQRRGLGLAAGHALYVVGKDAGRNALVVGPASELDHAVVRTRTWNWTAGQPEEDEPWRVEAQVRYRAAAAPAWLCLEAPGQMKATFDTAQRAPTPGQALVAYRGDLCLGGGVIAGAGDG